MTGLGWGVVDELGFRSGQLLRPDFFSYYNRSTLQVRQIWLFSSVLALSAKFWYFLFWVGMVDVIKVLSDPSRLLSY